MKKDTKKLFEFEESMLKHYKLFVQYLQRFARGEAFGECMSAQMREYTL